MKDPGPIAALTVALIVAALYSQGGVFQAFAALILLGVLITPVDGEKSLLESLIHYLSLVITQGVNTEDIR
jgi:hypothetical protein